MGRLLVLTPEHTILTYNLEKIVQGIETRYFGSAPIPTFMFLRNDWLAGPVFQSLLKHPDVRTSINRAFQAFPETIELDDRILQATQQDLGVNANVVLDWLVYNGRLYLSTDTGLYHLDMDWNSEEVQIEGRPEKRLDVRCLSTSAKYGAINASCGDEGLFTAVDEFGWINGKKDDSMDKSSDKSIKTGWLGFNVVNYRTQTIPLLLKSSRKQTEGRGIDQERTVLTAIGTEKIDLTYLYDSITQQYGVRRESIQYAFNSRNTVFIHTYDGTFYSIGVTQSSTGGAPKVRFTKTYKGENTHILSATATRVGILIETPDRVLVFKDGRWTTLATAEALSVRSFTTSRRFQHLIAITTEDGLLLTGLFSEPEEFVIAE
jgi:hypothetical protein